MWDLTPLLGEQADAERTWQPFGLVELPRRHAMVGALAAVPWFVIVGLPLQFLSPYNWLMVVIGVAVTIWVFTSRSQLGVRRDKHLRELMKARTNRPVYAGSAATTRVDDVRFMVQGWAPSAGPVVRGVVAGDADDVFGWDAADTGAGLVDAAPVDVGRLRTIGVADLG